MTDKQTIEEDMVNAKDFCPHYSCQVDCYEARMCQWFVDTLQQLKAKEEECERLKSDLTDLSKIIDCKNGTILTFKEKLEQLKKENKELKRKNANKRTSLKKMQFHISKLKAENDELKKTILQECPNCGEEYLNHKGGELYDENNQLKQAVKEIKEIANKNEVCPYDFSHHCYKYDCKRKEYCEIAKILQKCEVLKDE